MVSLLSGLGTFFGDQYLKKNVEHGKEFLNGCVTIKKNVNTGFIMNRASGSKWVLPLISMMFGVVTYLYLLTLDKKNRKIKRLGLALVVGGAASNLYDRIQNGGVTDYLLIKGLPKVVFNLADLAIVLGAVISFIGDLVGNDD